MTTDMRTRREQGCRVYFRRSKSKSKMSILDAYFLDLKSRLNQKNLKRSMTDGGGKSQMKISFVVCNSPLKCWYLVPGDSSYSSPRARMSSEFLVTTIVPTIRKKRRIPKSSTATTLMLVIVLMRSQVMICLEPQLKMVAP